MSVKVREVNGPSGALRRGWHRVIWEVKGERMYVVTDCITSVVYIEMALDACAEVTSDSIRTEAWSDWPHISEDTFAPDE